MLKLGAPIDALWIGEASTLLHDALIAGDPQAGAESGRYELELRRVGYEHGRQERRWLGLLKRWHFPRVPTLLVVAPVSGVRAVGEAAPAAEIDQLLGLHLDEGLGTLTVSTDFGGAVLDLGPAARLAVTDLGGPSEEQGVTDIGGRLLPAGWIDELETRRSGR